MSGKGNRQGFRLGCFGWFGVIALVIVAISYFGSLNGTSSPTKYQAYTDCQGAIEPHLKSPSSAEFSDKNFQYNPDDDTDFRVKMTVDSQNSFGAMVRSNFSCTMHFSKSTGDWTVVKVSGP